MCKIITLVGVNQSKKGDLLKFIKLAKIAMTFGDKDGFGYAATDGKTMFAERWLDIENAMKYRDKLTPQHRSILSKFREVVEGLRYNSEGEIDYSFNSVKTVLLHARASTNTINIYNTHPFISDDVALIHNGVISNHDKFPKKLSTCDSEAILQSYLNNVVPIDFKSISKVYDDLNGSMAVAALNMDTGGNPFVDVWRNNQSTLSFGIIEELGDARVFCTRPEHVVEICKYLKWKRPALVTFKPLQACRIDAVTGELIAAEKLTSAPTYDYSSSRGYGRHGDDFQGEGYWFQKDIEDREKARKAAAEAYEAAKKADETATTTDEKPTENAKGEYFDVETNTWKPAPVTALSLVKDELPEIKGNRPTDADLRAVYEELVANAKDGEVPPTEEELAYIQQEYEFSPEELKDMYNRASKRTS